MKLGSWVAVGNLTSLGVDGSMFGSQLGFMILVEDVDRRLGLLGVLKSWD